MLQLRCRRVRFSADADIVLRTLKTRTGVTPNLLCRLALAVSLEEPGTPDVAGYPEDSDREISRGTLLGEHEYLMTALVAERVRRDGMLPESLDDQFRAHLHRGISMLNSRLKELPDTLELCASREVA